MDRWVCGARKWAYESCTEIRDAAMTVERQGRLKRYLGVLTPLTNIVTLPSTLAHEATHAAFAVPFADDVVLSIYPEVYIGVDYQDDAPESWMQIVMLAPLTMGLVTGFVTLIWLAVSGERPSLLSGGLIGLWWLHYTLSGLGDLAMQPDAGEARFDGVDC